MNLVSAKKNSDIQLPGLCVDIERIDGSIKTITLSCGDKVVVIRGDWSGMSVAVPAPPKLVKRWRLTGALKGLTVDESFETMSAATERMEELELADGDIAEFDAAAEDGE